MDLGLNNARVLVTGGAGGIGAEIVRAFASEGAQVTIHYHTSGDAARALADEVGGVAIGADLTIEDQANVLIPTAVEVMGGLDVCVANAGWYPQQDQALWDLPLDRWRSVMDRNLTATFLTARGFLKHAATTERGSLVLVGSTAGQFGEAGHADYAAAKGAIMSGLLASVKNEAARIGDGVRVNAVAPGWTITPKRAAAGIDDDTIAAATATMARKELAVPGDVARQILVLASDVASAHQTGQIVTVAGGMEGRII
ncbi:MAG: SDR family oxidoreductase [Actinomycetia bacterium]|nr:SDR family oxidoreductase [Actinomycetes bacterium]